MKHFIEIEITGVKRENVFSRKHSTSYFKKLNLTSKTKTINKEKICPKKIF